MKISGVHQQSSCVSFPNSPEETQGEIGGGKKSRYLDKSKLPFGDDLNDYVDRVGGGNIDIDSKVKWV